MKMQLGLRDQRSTYAPGEELAGAVLWESAEKPETAEVRLFWFTRGKGTEDSEVVATEVFANPLPGDTRPFQFRLPDSPYIFNGKLIGLTWAVELVIQPGDHFERVTFTMAPGGKEVVLPAQPAPVTNSAV